MEFSDGCGDVKRWLNLKVQISFCRGGSRDSVL